MADKSKSENKSSKSESQEAREVESLEEGKDGVRAKKYSDKRKGDRLRREKEKADKLRKEDGIITIEDDSSRDGSRDNILEGLSTAAAEIVTLNDTASDSAESDKKGRDKKKTFRDRREERRREKERQEDGGKEGKESKESREAERERRDRKFKKPDMQIYRPGMGRFSKTRKDEDESAKTSPEDSREPSPHKKVSSKPAGEKKSSRTRKKNHDDEDVSNTGQQAPAQKDASSTPLPTPVSTPKEEVKPFAAPDPQVVEVEPPAPVAKGKSYRANRMAKQKKPVEESAEVAPLAANQDKKEKADQQEKPAGERRQTADNEKEAGDRSQKETRPSFDDDNIPPLTASKRVITLDNDQ